MYILVYHITSEINLILQCNMLHCRIGLISVIRHCQSYALVSVTFLHSYLIFFQKDITICTMKDINCLHYTLTITIYVLNSCTAIVLIVIDYILCVIKIVIINKAI